jgi:hypothetical protein
MLEYDVGYTITHRGKRKGVRNIRGGLNETEARREKKSGKAKQSEGTNCEFIIKKKSATVYTGRRGRGQGR